MTQVSQYQGSQALNNSFSFNEFVNTNTGSFTLTKKIAKLMGLTSQIGLDLSLCYVPGIKGTLSLPDNWAFNLSYVLPGGSLTIGGSKNSIIDLNWQDSEGYKSGLRYVNDHGVKFEEFVVSQSFPDGKGNYKYKLRDGEGACSYFDATGKLVRVEDLFGNTIRYYYSDQQKGVFNNSLDHIIDSFGQKICFGYMPNTFIITLPSGVNFTINYSNRGVENIVDDLGETTVLGYIQNSELNVVNTIKYPSGLQSTVDYTTIGYKTTSGFFTKPAVQKLVRYEEVGSISQIHSQTIYAYGTDTDGATYTGESGGYLLSDTGDGLMDSNNLAYIYDVLIQNLDAENNLISATRTYFNYLHCPTQSVSYVVQSGQVTNPAYKRIYTYIATTDKHARTVNFNKPICTECFVYSSETESFIPLKKTEENYDHYGKNLKTSVDLYDRIQKKYLPQNITQSQYLITKWGGEMPQTLLQQDCVTGFENGIDYTLSDDEKTVQFATSKYRKSESDQWTPWKVKETNFQCGQLQQTTLSWAEGSAPDQRSIKSTNETYDYSYDPSTHQFKVLLTDALNHKSVKIYDVSLPSGKIVSMLTPLGEKTTYTYYPDGRQREAIDALGNIISTSYCVYLKDGINSVTITGANGYKIQNITDAMGRSIKVLDNGDSTQKGTPKTSRILSETSYGGWGKIVSHTTRLGLIVNYQYDFLGRLIETVDIFGNIRNIDINDSGLMSTQKINNIVSQVTRKDSLGQTIGIDQYANPSDQSINYYKSNEINYDGCNRKIEITHSTIDLKTNSVHKISSLQYQHDADGNVIHKSYKGYNPSLISVDRYNIFDLLNNKITYNKVVKYNNKIYNESGEVNTYDAIGKLTNITDQLNNKETFSYDANGCLINSTRFDGTSFIYTYDALGCLLKMSWGDKSIIYTYDERRSTKTVTHENKTISYDYYLDGGCKSVTYPGGLMQCYDVDKYSKVTSVTDVSGTVTTDKYNKYGQLISRCNQIDTINFEYKKSNGLNSILVGLDLSGLKDIKESYIFDGFGRMLTENVSDSSGQSILKSIYAHDETGRLESLTVSSQLSSDKNVNYSKVFTYDSLNQLLSSQTSFTDKSSPQEKESYVYDGNYNVINKIENGISQAFQYNAINQLQGSSIKYDKNGRMTNDDQGNIYTYNALDQLIKVSKDTEDIASYLYHSDSSLSTILSKDHSNIFYYDSSVANAINFRSKSSSQDSWSTILTGNGKKIASYEKGKGYYYYMVNNSTALTQIGSSKYSSFDYSNYGVRKSSEIIPTNKNFMWNQELMSQETGLVYLRSRFYNPALMRFMTMDNKSLDNKYAYCNGDPINGFDPTGHFNWGLFAGIAVGIAATVLTGGVGGVAATAVAGLECVEASVFVGAIAGAAGSISGDATTAGINHQHFSGDRAALDLVIGFTGGAVGSALGGYAGRVAMRAALDASMSQAAITNIGVATSGIVGGGAGSLASSGISSAATGSQFFSKNTGISFAVGTAAGMGGGLLTSGSYLGKLNPAVIPVPLENTELITPAKPPEHIELEQNLHVMAPMAEAKASMSGFEQGGKYNSVFTLDNTEGSKTYDTVAVHGGGNTLYASVDYLGAGEGEPTHVRPITGERFAQYLKSENLDLSNEPLKLMSCFAGFRNAQTIADALQRPVYAGYPLINRYTFTNWSIFNPNTT